MKEVNVTQHNKSDPLKKIGNILGIVINVILITVGAFLIFISLSNGKTGTGASVFGYSLMQVKSNSMEASDTEYEIATMPAGSLVLLHNIPRDEDAQAQYYQDLEIGDVITFASFDLGELVTHRIIKIDTYDNDSEHIIQFTTRGDANPENTVETVNTTEDVIKGDIVWVSVIAGQIYGTITAPTGILFFVVIPAAVMFIIELMRVITILNTMKMEKLKVSNTEQIEELKRQLLQLQGKDTPTIDDNELHCDAQAVDECNAEDNAVEISIDDSNEQSYTEESQLDESEDNILYKE